MEVEARVHNRWVRVPADDCIRNVPALSLCLMAPAPPEPNLFAPPGWYSHLLPHSALAPGLGCFYMGYETKFGLSERASTLLSKSVCVYQGDASVHFPGPWLPLSTEYCRISHPTEKLHVHGQHTLAVSEQCRSGASCKSLVFVGVSYTVYKLRCNAPTQKGPPTRRQSIINREARLVAEHAISCSVLGALYCSHAINKPCR